MGMARPLLSQKAVLGAGGLHHPVAYLLDQGGLLGDGDELPGWHHGAVGLLPAQRRLYARERAVVDPVLGLVVQYQLVVAQGIRAAGLLRKLALLFFRHGFTEEDMVALAARLAMWTAVSACCIRTR